jgi:hypothetical protein
MAIEKIVKINVNAQEALKELTKLGKQFEEDFEKADNLSAEIGALEDALYEMARAGKSGTKEFDALSAEIGKMKKVIIDTDRTVDGMSQTMAQNLGGALGGVTAAFELGAGAMGAMGVESEKVEEALLKVQSAMAIAQGVQGIREAIPAFNGLKNSIVSAVSGLSNFQKALLATGLGAIVAVVGALAANWDKVTQFLKGTTKEQEAYNEVSNKAVEIATEELNALDKLQRTLDNENLSRKDKNLAVQKLQEEYPNLLQNIDSEKVSLDDLNKAIELNSELVMLNAQMQAIAELRSEAMKEKIQAATDAQTGQNESFLDGFTSLFAYTNGLGDYVDKEKLAAQRTKEATKEAEDKINVYDELENSIKSQVTALKEQLGVTDDQSEAEKKLEEQRKKNAEELKARTIAEMEENARLSRDADNFLKEYEERKALEKELKDKELTEDIERQRALTNEIQASLDAELAIEEAKVDAAIEADNKKKELAKEELLREQALQDAKLSLASESLSAISNLVNTFAGKSEESQKRAFKITKAMNIAQAVMDTYKGANAIFASAAANPSTILFPAQPFITAGIAIASGLANVATIARQEFQGGSSGGGGGGGSAANAVTAMSTPANFNVVGNTGTNQLADTLGNSPMKAYVVAGDVTSAQSLERNKIQQSTL